MEFEFDPLTRDKKISIASFAWTWWDPPLDSSMQKTLKGSAISLSITLSGHMTNFIPIKKDTLWLILTSMQTNNMSLSKSVCKFYQMPGKVITAAYLPMVKQGQVNRIRWSVMEPIRVSCQFLANKYLIEQTKMMIKTNNMRSMFLCFKFIMKKSKIYLFLSASVQSKV